MDWLFPVALALTGTMGALMSLWGLWYLISGLACVKRPTDYGIHPPQTRFAVLIAARNDWSSDRQPAGPGLPGGAL